MVEVILDENDRLDWALKQFRRKLIRSGLFKDMKKRRFYEKPSEAKKRKAAAARRRNARARRRVELRVAGHQDVVVLVNDLEGDGFGPERLLCCDGSGARASRGRIARIAWAYRSRSIGCTGRRYPRPPPPRRVPRI